MMAANHWIPKRKYDPKTIQCDVGRGVIKNVKDMTRDELEQALCREIRFTEEVLFRLNDIREASHRFGWAGTW